MTALELTPMHRLATANIRNVWLTLASSNDATLQASGLRQTDCILFSLALARVTFARMSEAFAVQMNGFG